MNKNALVDEKTINRLRGLKVAIIIAESGGAKGGAERFYEGLCQAFLELGCLPDLIPVSANEPDFETILSNYRNCSELDLSKYDFVVSTKVPTYAVNHPNHVLYLVHTVRVFDDLFEETFSPISTVSYEQRAELHRLDFQSISSAKARFAIGHEVARRLYRWRGLDAKVLHPPLAFNKFRNSELGDYFFIPGRLHKWKRIDLLINAVKNSTLNIKLVIAGEGEAESYLKELAGADGRIKFLGRIDDEELVSLYGGCLAVPFVPLREDYGYVTLEAFASGKAVLTCSDSGEPSHIVQHLETGLVVDPTPLAICKGMELLWSDRAQTALMGKRGQLYAESMSWRDTALELAAGALNSDADVCEQEMKVVVVDMQPIDPPVGGGRLRLLGLYHNLGSGAQCTYVGSYDWSGEPYRDHKLSSTLREIDVPLSVDHHAAALALSRRAGGKVVIDLAFSQQVQLSNEYLKVVREQITIADVVVFSHPWLYSVVKDQLRPDQIIIYDSHNVEGYLRAQLLNYDNKTEADILECVIHDENELGWAADWILACSHEDLLRFNRIYGFQTEKMRVIPNGVMAFSEETSKKLTKKIAKERLNLDTKSFLVIFIGSSYGPNIEAANFIVDNLAPLMPDVTFVIAGGVGEKMKPVISNVLITGRLSEAEKNIWLCASDVAINPMMSGSGTNIKMFDFMAMSLPVVTTEIGARGIECGGNLALIKVGNSAEDFALGIDALMEADKREMVGLEARKCVEAGYAWERISSQLGCFIKSRVRIAGQPKPYFSVIIPTYERHANLNQLIEKISKQIERDFEVVIIDQSDERWPMADNSFGFPLVYFHTPVKGAVRARNTGALIAQGSILAFVDDDCLPEAEWLMSAREYFKDPAVLGVEGLIYSDHLGEENWRPVTNVGFEGIGYMTANLLVRSGAFQYLGGFDLQFDSPHFREDTDFGWRLAELGSVPYAKDVRVFHPAQPKSLVRESNTERCKFFQNDALLYKKHPLKYRELFFRECHYKGTPGFIDNLIIGFENEKLCLPHYIKLQINK